MRSVLRVSLPATLFVILLSCDRPGPTAPPPPPACTYAVSTSSLAFTAQGGSATLSVTTAAGCVWGVSSDREWVTITSGATGVGPGIASVTASPNSTTTARQATLTVAGRTVAVTQGGLSPCVVLLTPLQATFLSDGGTGEISVVTPSHCAWTAVSAATWITITSGAAGLGDGVVSYSVNRHHDTLPRTATVVVNEGHVVITQEPDVSACVYEVAPVTFTPCMSAPFDMSALVTTQAGCRWTATAAAPWITVVDDGAGEGAGRVTFRVSDNWDAPRQGVVQVRWPTPTAGQNLQVEQAGCYYAVSTGLIQVAPSGGSAQFDVVQSSVPNTCGGPLQNACVWTAVSEVPWIAITTPMPQAGDNAVRFTVMPNATGAPRTATIGVRGLTVTVVQGGGSAGR